MTVIKSLARTMATLLIFAVGCAGAYELWNYYMYSPWTRDAQSARRCCHDRARRRWVRD